MFESLFSEVSTNSFENGRRLFKHDEDSTVDERHWKDDSPSVALSRAGKRKDQDGFRYSPRINDSDTQSANYLREFDGGQGTSSRQKRSKENSTLGPRPNVARKGATFIYDHEQTSRYLASDDKGEDDGWKVKEEDAKHMAERHRDRIEDSANELKEKRFYSEAEEKAGGYCRSKYDDSDSVEHGFLVKKDHWAKHEMRERDPVSPMQRRSLDSVSSSPEKSLSCEGHAPKRPEESLEQRLRVFQVTSPYQRMFNPDLMDQGYEEKTDDKRGDCGVKLASPEVTRADRIKKTLLVPPLQSLDVFTQPAVKDMSPQTEPSDTLKVLCEVLFSIKTSTHRSYRDIVSEAISEANADWDERVGGMTDDRFLSIFCLQTDYLVHYSRYCFQ